MDRKGTTASEQHEGESLDERLGQEVPDVTVRDDEASADVDEEAAAGEATGSRDGGAVGAEESAVHVVPEDDVAPPDRPSSESSGRR